MDCLPWATLTRRLTEQWNGALWNVVAGPNVDPSFNQLYAVAVVAARDIWTVGSSGGLTNAAQALVEQWNGTSWSVVPSADVGGTTASNFLNAVAIVSATDSWAVGQDGRGEPLTEHWNGTNWQVVSSIPLAITGDTLLGVAAITTTNVWTVGVQMTSSSDAFTTAPLIEQYCC